MALIFKTKRLIVRQFEESDMDNFFRLTGNAAVMQYIRPVSTKEENDAFLLENIEAYQVHPKRGRWAVTNRITKKFVGSFAIIPIPDDREKIQLGYSLLPENWGRGYATELTLGGLDYFFTHESLPEIYGVTELPNTASQHVLLKAGFKPYGSMLEKGKELKVFIFRKTG